jgi:hypothetical protein
LLIVQDTVAQAGPDHTGSRLRPQRHAVAVAIREGIHFLFDDIGQFTDGTRKEFRTLEHRQTDPTVAIVFEDLRRARLDPFPQSVLVRQDVVHPAHRLDNARHMPLLD